MKRVLALQQFLAAQAREHKGASRLQRLERLMAGIRNVAFFEKLGIGDDDGRYLVLDGTSWQSVCKMLGIAAAPNLVMWKEDDFFSLLEAEVGAADNGDTLAKKTKGSSAGQTEEG
jgi:hypothetical protein